MPINFRDLIESKSDKALWEYLNNTNIYTIEAINAALNELKKRGNQFSKQELDLISAKIREKIELKKKEDEELELLSFDKNIVDDLNFPQYYSPGTIWLFSVVFTVFIGGVLLSFNITNKKHKLIILGFSILYTSGIIMLIEYFSKNQLPIYLLNAFGAIILTQVFWVKFIGKHAKFRKKPIWKPLIISILIMVIFFILDK